MVPSVSVKFAQDKRYEFELHEGELAAATPESARRWFDQQFVGMGCEPTNPTGKTLLVDKILGVVRAMGEEPFARNDRAARELARNAIVALERNAVAIDVAALSVR